MRNMQFSRVVKYVLAGTPDTGLLVYWGGFGVTWVVAVLYFVSLWGTDDVADCIFTVALAAGVASLWFFFLPIGLLGWLLWWVTH